MKCMYIFACLLTASTFYCLSEKTVYLLIHGTWSKSQWHTAYGEFFKTLESVIDPHDSVIPFIWSGKNSHAARQEAAHNLVKIIQSYPNGIRFVIIAHSHGGNIVNLASQMLPVSSTYAFDMVIYLATPVDMQSLYPNMHVIKRGYQFFSFNDHIQPVFGQYQREFDSDNLEQIFNVRITMDGREPNHTGIHSSLLAQWIPCLVAYHKQFLHDHDIQDNKTPLIWHLSENKKPYFTKDLLRKKRIAHDIKENAQFHIMCRNLFHSEGYRLMKTPKKILRKLKNNS